MDVLVLLWATTAHAQLGTGSTWFRQYDIWSGAELVGHVVVVPDDLGPSAQRPNGFEAGKEYWWWDPAGEDLGLDGFRLVPATPTLQEADKDWDIVEYAVFDLHTNVLLPRLHVTATELLYEVLRVDHSTKPSTVEPVALLWLEGGIDGVQHWYALDGVLERPTIGDDADALWFRPLDAPPVAGSLEVHPLAD
jgi:hypothetical protein